MVVVVVIGFVLVDVFVVIWSILVVVVVVIGFVLVDVVVVICSILVVVVVVIGSIWVDFDVIGDDAEAMVEGLSVDWLPMKDWVVPSDFPRVKNSKVGWVSKLIGSCRVIPM